jgi:superfamily I DNA and/or RNA helicase
MERIASLPARNLAFNKRKRGILRKAIEMSLYCEKDVFMVIFDRDKKRLVEFSSSAKFSLRALKKMYSTKNLRKFRYEKYHNDDYELLENDMSDRKFIGLKPTNR